jgi:hypothetical protein
VNYSFYFPRQDPVIQAAISGSRTINTNTRIYFTAIACSGATSLLKSDIWFSSRTEVELVEGRFDLCFAERCRTLEHLDVEDSSQPNGKKTLTLTGPIEAAETIVPPCRKACDSGRRDKGLLFAPV